MQSLGRQGPRRDVPDTRTEGFGDEVKLRILLGTFCLCSGYYDDYYVKATKRAHVDPARLRTRIYESCDVLAAPTSPFPAFRLGEKVDDPLAMYLCDLLTTPANLAGIPGMSIPCGATAGRPTRRPADPRSGLR